MKVVIDSINLKEYQGSVIFLYGDEVSDKALSLRKDEIAYVKELRNKDKKGLAVFDRLPYRLYVQNFDSELGGSESQEQLRRAASDLQELLCKEGQQEVYVTGEGVLPEELVAFVEGLLMSDYRFTKYKRSGEKGLDLMRIDERLIAQEDLDITTRKVR